MNFRSALLIAAIAAAMPFVTAAAQDRVALVVGNSTYNDGQNRPRATGDATAVAQLLRKMNFEVTLGTDLDRKGMQNVLGQFLGKLGTAKIVFFFYAGRSIQMADDYLMPTDANLKSPLDAHTSSIEFETVLQELAKRGRTLACFVDTDRDELQRKLHKATAEFIPALQLPAQTAIVFATAPGTPRFPVKGEHSTMVAALLQDLPTPGEDISTVAKHIRRDIGLTTQGHQTPWEITNLTGDTYLVPAKQGVDAKP